MTSPFDPVPDALLFTTPACPHCPGMKRSLAQLASEGGIGAVDIVDVSREPDRAQALGVRSVPWLRLGAFRFEGQMSLGELRRWAQLAADPKGMAIYFFEMLKSGRRARVEELIREDAQRSALLAGLVTDPEAGMAVRLGIGAVLEELAGTEWLEPMVPSLAAALEGAEPRDRADLAHFLSLIGSDAARSVLRGYIEDDDAEVREIAREVVGDET